MINPKQISATFLLRESGSQWSVELASTGYGASISVATRQEGELLFANLTTAVAKTNLQIAEADAKRAEKALTEAAISETIQEA